MTQNLEEVTSPSGPTAARSLPARNAVGAGTAPQWWRRPWVIPLIVVVIAFLTYVWPPYVGLDPSKSKTVLNPNAPEHYPLVVAHIMFGTVAMVTLCLQLWPKLRRRHLAVHRWSGRLYVFGGALPGSLCALAIVFFVGIPGGGGVGLGTGALLWFAATVMGYIRVRQRRYLQHRRWMLYSFGLAMSIVWGRVIFLMLPVLHLDNETVLVVVADVSTWLPWVVNIFLVQWWLERTSGRTLQQLI